MVAEPTGQQTVRERIVDHVVATLAEDLLDVPFGFDLVIDHGLTKSDLENKTRVLGVYDQTETVTPLTGYDLRRLSVVVEGHCRVGGHQTRQVATVLRQCIAQIEWRLSQDIYRGQLALNTESTGSELDIDGAYEHYASAVVVFAIQYRTRANDPYSLA